MSKLQGKYMAKWKVKCTAKLQNTFLPKMQCNCMDKVQRKYVVNEWLRYK
jgi:hypothetical protein